MRMIPCTHWPGRRGACGAAVMATLLLVTRPAAADYRFIGDLLSYESVPSGALLTCAPGVRLQLRFLTPSMIRVTLTRPDIEEPLLEHAISRTEWAPVNVRVAETSERITLSSDSVDVVVFRTPCRLALQDRRGLTLVEHDTAMAIGWDGNEVRSWHRIDAADRFFGLGEKTGNLDKRGEEWVLWNTDHFAYGVNSDPIYQSIPFFVGIRGGAAFGIYLNNSARSTFNFGAGNHRYYSFAADQGPLDYFLIYGPDAAQVVSRYTELTGRTPLPPLWGLGFQQSRWSYYPAEEVLRIARTFREKQIPADVLYLDIDYMDEYRVFTWDRNRFPDPAGMLRKLQDIGFKVVTIIDPGVKVDTAYAIAREGIAGNHFIRYPDTTTFVGSVWPGPTYFPDYSRPETQRWWGAHLARLIESGVDGIWNDMNEPAVWGRAFPLEVRMHDGGRWSSQKRMHNLYGLLMSQTAYQQLRHARPAQRPFVLTRAGFSGIQRYSAVWTGDNVASWEHLALGIRLMVGMGVSGVPFIGTDVGGFVGTPSPELFARWVQVGVFSPFLRAHTTANTLDQEPWSFGERVEGISRDFITLRYRLLPYLYSLFWEAHQTGAPIMRPLFWHFQTDSLVYRTEFQHQFMAGEHLLVAPVVAEGETVKRVYLPAGRWLDVNTDSIYEGGRTVFVDAPLERMPMFLRAGGVLPMQEPAQWVGQDVPNDLTLDVFPAADVGGGFELYEDDGTSHAYENGAYRLTRLQAIRSGESVTLAREVRHGEHAVPAGRLLRIRVRGMRAAPQTVTVNGRALSQAADSNAAGWAYDTALRTVTVRVREEGERQEILLR